MTNRLMPVFLGHYRDVQEFVPGDGVDASAFILTATAATTASDESRLAVTLMDGTSKVITFAGAQTPYGAISGLAGSGALVMKAIAAQPTSPESTDTEVAAGCTITLYHLV